MIIAMEGTIKIDGEPNDIHEIAMMEREELERCAYGVVAGSTLQ